MNDYHTESEIKPAAPASVAATIKRGITLRQLIDLVGTEYLDAELNLQILNGRDNPRFAIEPPNVWARPRFLLDFPLLAGQPLINFRVKETESLPDVDAIHGQQKG